MFSSGNVYRHSNAKDLDIVVFAVLEDLEDKVRLRVAYIKQTNRAFFSSPNTEHGLECIYVNKKDFPYWTLVA